MNDITNNSPTGGAHAPDPNKRQPKPLAPSRNPFQSGFSPNGRRKKQGGSYVTKRALLRYMLEVDITVQDLPTVLADEIRALWPGMFENIEKKFSWGQVLELTQLKLVLSKSEKVRQQAINSIKDRTEGRPMQKIQVQQEDEEETELVLPNGLKIRI